MALRSKGEEALQKLLVEEGWEILHKGFPDFVCFRGEEMMLIEVKPSYGHRLKFDQIKMLLKLAGFGVPCYRWTPDLGLEKVTTRMAMPWGDHNKLAPNGKHKRGGPRETLEQRKSRIRAYIKIASPEIKEFIVKKQREGKPWWDYPWY